MSSNFLFYFFSIGLIFSAFMVITINHAMFALLFLVSSFLFSAFLLFLLECEFLGLIFIIVYVGAISVLFLFAVMMLETKFINLSKNVIKYVPVGLLFAIVILIYIAIEVLAMFNQNVNDVPNMYLNIYQNWYDLTDSITDIQVYGQVLYSYYVFHLLIIGLILLEVLIGVVYLTNNYNIRQKRLDQAVFKQLAREPKFFL